MKFNNLIVVCFGLLFYGCDHSLPLHINDNKSYEIRTKCGKIVVQTSNFLGQQIFISQEFDGSGFVLNTDSLLIAFSPRSSNSLKSKYYVTRNGKEIRNAEYIIDRPEEVNLVLFLNGGLIDEQLMILPCGYIKCNGKSLIQDTIRISPTDASAQS